MEPIEYVWKDRKRPREVKELIHKHVEAAKDKRRMRAMEVMGDDGNLASHHDGDGLFDDDPLE